MATASLVIHTESLKTLNGAGSSRFDFAAI